MSCEKQATVVYQLMTRIEAGVAWKSNMTNIEVKRRAFILSLQYFFSPFVFFLLTYFPHYRTRYEFCVIGVTAELSTLSITSSVSDTVGEVI